MVTDVSGVVPRLRSFKDGVMDETHVIELQTGSRIASTSASKAGNAIFGSYPSRMVAQVLSGSSQSLRRSEGSEPLFQEVENFPYQSNCWAVGAPHSEVPPYNCPTMRWLGS